MKKVLILGSTGSLGTQTLEVLKNYKKQFKICGILANKSEKILAEQKSLHKINIALLASEFTENDLKKQIHSLIQEAEVVVNVLPGIAGIEPSMQALKAGKTRFVWNKEYLVAEGKEMMSLSKKHNASIIPLDSEHNAIFEILKANPGKKIDKIVLTASGGPFFGCSKEELKEVKAEEALRHPMWKMGPKVTVESATLINKGLEIIEAHHLFGVPLEKIEVKVDTECQIHAIVKFRNGKTFAYISPPDMREHIKNAFAHILGEPPSKSVQPINLSEHQLQNPDHKTFPGINLVLEAFAQNREKNFIENEEKVINQFLNNEIKFLEIFKKLQGVL